MPTSSSPPCSFSSIGAVWYSYRRNCRRGRLLRIAGATRGSRYGPMVGSRATPRLPASRSPRPGAPRPHPPAPAAALEEAPPPRPDLFTGRGERDVVGRPLDELHPESLLELFQLRRQRRLADEAARGSTAEVTVVGHGHQVAQVLEFQLHGPREIYGIYREDRINRLE